MTVCSMTRSKVKVTSNLVIFKGYLLLFSSAFLQRYLRDWRRYIRLLTYLLTYLFTFTLLSTEL